MKKNIVERTLSEAKYMIKTKKTIREIAYKFNISKSTVHKDLNERLKNIDKKIYLNIQKILKEHINTRHYRGGEATRKKYASIK